jgi:hypothetical protein
MYPQDPTVPGQPPQAPQTPGTYPAGYPGTYPAGYPGTYPGAPTPKSKKWIPAVALAAAAALAGSGYAFYQDRHTSSDCSVEGATTTKLDRKSDSEPTISVPLTKGWVGVDQATLSTGPSELTSPYLRGVIVNTGIKERDFSPNVVVTLEKSNAASSQEANEQAINTGRQAVGATITAESTHQVCGNTVYQSDFAPPNWLRNADTANIQTGSWFITTVAAADGGLWLATATLQTRNPENPDYIAERDALQDGFRMEAVGGG